VSPDVVIIGGGRAGQAAALAANWKRRVTVVDDNGTLSPKQLEQGMLQTFIEAINSGHNFDRAALLAREYRLHQQQNLPAKRRLQEQGITVITDVARIDSSGAVHLDNNGRMQSKKVVLATGSTPISISVPGAELLPATTSLFDREQPSRLVIIGSSNHDDELIAALGRVGTRVSTVDSIDQLSSIERLQKSWRLNTLHDGVPWELGSDFVLVWPQRRPRLDGIVGVPLSHPDGLQVNHKHQTSRRRVYAVGSCLAPGQSQRSSVEQGLAVGARLAGRF
jgi:pyruvate/2-oxoglutarate dehydrogenase complex dihydrolipoamide dehydrogenase (E3) component